MTITLPLKVRGSGASWQVFDGNDIAIGKPYRRIEKAEEAQVSLERKALHKQRPCLCCQKSFLSEGPHNRMCHDCRKETEGMA